MVNIKAITDLATLGLGAYIFFRAFPLVERFLGNGAAAAPVAVRAPPLPPIPVEKMISELAAASVIPGTPIGVGQEAFAVQAVAAPIGLIPGATFLGIGLAPTVAPYAQQPTPYVYQPPVVPQPVSQIVPGGQFWVNPITGETMLPYVAGAPTPPSVLRLRKQDIFPAIRGF